MGFNSLHEDTYTLMMLSDSLYHRDWCVGLIVWFLQCALAILAIVGVNNMESKATFSIPYQTPIEVTITQPLSLFVMFYSQDDVFNAVAYMIDLRLNGPHPWGGIPIAKKLKESKRAWMRKILIPNFLKFSQGLLVLFTS